MWGAEGRRIHSCNPGNGYWATCETWMTLAVWLRGQRCECVGREIPKHHGPDFSADPTPLPSV